MKSRGGWETHDLDKCKIYRITLSLSVLRLNQNSTRLLIKIWDKIYTLPFLLPLFLLIMQIAIWMVQGIDLKHRTRYISRGWDKKRGKRKREHQIPRKPVTASSSSFPSLLSVRMSGFLFRCRPHVGEKRSRPFDAKCGMHINPIIVVTSFYFSQRNRCVRGTSR